MDILLSLFIILFGLMLLIKRLKVANGALKDWYQVHPNKKLLWDGIYKFSALIGGIFFIIAGLISLINIILKRY